MRQIVAGILLLCTALFGASSGELSVYVLKNGAPMASQEVVVTRIASAEGNLSRPAGKKNIFATDRDGYLFARLDAPAEYQVQLIGREAGRVLAYAKKSVRLLPEKMSQIIFSLDENNSLSFADVEAEGAAAAETAEKVSPEARGTVMLSLHSGEDDKAVGGARVFVRGTGIEGVSDKEGQLSLNLPEGEQVLSVIHSNFSAQTLTVQVVADETVTRLVELTPASMELEEFVVIAPQIEGGIAAVMAEVRNSEAIANVIGSAQMAKQGDSNAASALKRVPGITIIGGKYIYVRGLGDRYSSTELNGMSLPSPNPIKRTVPLDMFPGSVIGSLQVQKTFTPDITGAFGGGYVNVRTKQRVDEDHVSVKVGLIAHDSAGKSATSYEGSETDWTGFDHSYRPFPNSFTDSALPTVGSTPPSLQQSTFELRNMILARDADPQRVSVPYGGEGQLEVGKKFTVADEHELTFLASYGYKTHSSLRTYTSHDYIISREGVQESEPDNTAVTDLFRTDIQHGGIFNAGYNYRNFDLKYTKLYVLNTLDQTRDINGTFGENNSREHLYYFEWQERELNIDQLVGGLDYDPGVKNRLDFGGEYAQASEYVPNDIYYNYKQYFSTRPYEFRRPDSKLTYNYRTTDDDLYNLFVKNRMFLPMLSDEDYLEIGAVTESKERKGRRVELQMQSSISDIGTTSGGINELIMAGDDSRYDFSLTSQPKDQYDAALDRNAYYVKALIKPTEALDLTFGARYVDLEQSVDQYKVEENRVVIDRNRLAFNKVLPSVGAKYLLDERNQFRFAYSQTFIYPDFREFVNTEFIHPVFLAKVSGNPDLVETDIRSVDARYEYYFDATDSLTAALFYKQMDNPIEDTQAFTTGTLPRFSFDNSASATLAGIELSWFRHLGFIDPILENLVFSGNYTYIDSKVELTAEQKAKFVTQDRGLQGLSPQVINLSLSYDDPGSRSVNLSYNKMARRLMRVALKNGDVILGLDDYEIPPHLVDFTWIEKFTSGALGSDIDVTFKARNLLDGETVWEQGSNTTLKYKTGRSYTLSVSAKF